jgi:adenylate cyclase
MHELRAITKNQRIRDRARDVARRLGVVYVVEGSVRKAGNRVRITAQLIDGGSGNHVWAQRHDRDLADIFAVQDEITSTLVGAIEPELGRAERRAGPGEASGRSARVGSLSGLLPVLWTGS